MLKKRAEDAWVGVRVAIDADGRVTDVASSLTVLSSAGPFAGDFRAAVEEAIRQWQFQPAEIRHLEMTKDPMGDYLRLARRESIEWAFDVQFRFSASGEVLAGRPE